MPPTEEDRLRLSESAKWLAHVDTLSAGSIVVIATFAEKFKDQGPSWLLALAVVGFAITIAASLFGAFVIIGVLRADPEPSETEANLWINSVLATFASFAVALGSLATFAAFAVT